MRRRKTAASKHRRTVKTTRRLTSSTSKDEFRFALLRRKLSEARQHRRRAEQALRESEYKRRQMIESAFPGMLWVTGPDGEVTHVNQRTLDFTGARSVEDLLNLGWEKFLHPEDFPKTVNAFFHAIQTGESYENLQRVRRVDGEYRWHHVRAEPLRDREGCIIEWYGLSIDIDDGKKVEDRLRRSEAYLAESQRLSHTGTAVFNQTEVFYWSDETYRFFEFDPSQGTPSRDAVWQRVHPDDASKRNEVVERAVSEKRSVSTEFRIIARDGTVKYIHTINYPVFSSDGAFVEIIGTAIDVTERKQAEEALRRDEAWLAQAQRLSHTGTWVMNGTTRRFLYWSDESYRIWGLDPLQGLPSREDMWARIHPDDRERVWEEVQEAMREQRDFFAEFRLLLPDGTVKYLEANTRHEFSPLGALIEVLCTSVDVTERKRAEQALQASEAKFRAAIDGITGLVAIMAPSGELEAVNRPIIEYFGRTVEELGNWGTSDAVHPEDLPSVLESYKTSLATGTPFHQELRLRRFDGEYRWFENRGAPIRDESGRIARWYCLLVDIEDRTRALERLQQLQSDFAHMNRVSMMGELAASLSHEIAQPVAAARNFARAALNFLDQQPPKLSEVKKQLDRVVDAGDRSREIIERIRDHIKKAPPRMARFDLNRAIDEVIALGRSAITRNGVSVRTHLAEGLRAVEGDRVQLQQVVLKLDPERGRGNGLG
jgi:PAS domain S-box-containing protein